MTGNAIEGLRTQIEALDAEILARVAERTELARRIGAAKRSRSSGPLDPAREAAVIRRGDLTGVRLRTDGATPLRWIRLGARHGGMVEVLGGLQVDDTILVPDAVGTAAGSGEEG